MAEYTSERVSPDEYSSSTEDRLIFLLHQKTYLFALDYVGAKNVLDFGCGDGYGTRMLAERSAVILGIDVDPAAIELARKKYSHPSLAFRHIGGLPLPFESESFDVVLSFQVIEHVDDVPFYLEEIHRILKKGGRFLLTTPNAKSRLLFFQNPWNKHHLREYTPGQLTQVLTPDFQIEHVHGLTYTPDWIAVENRRVYRNKWLLWPLSNKLVPDSLRRRLLQSVWNFAHRKDVQPRSSVARLPKIDDVVVTSSDVPASPSLLVISTPR
jgi:2-polyprenyl-3-methyl-5-hydroxy-6-metoxy-1,4-benzoquinol methylase